MQRVDDWATKLAEFIDERRNQPFEWGVNDCVLFTADAVEAITGVDVATELRDRYTTSVGSLRALRAEGYETISDSIDSKLGESVDRSSIRRGDVVEYMTDNGPTTGICLGHVVTSPGKDGLVFMSRKHINKGWRV